MAEVVMRKANRAGRWYGAVLAAALVVFPLLAPPLGAAPQVIPVAPIVPGMTGIGKTVFLGTTVSEFQVKTLGVLLDAGPAGALVLFRASGPAIEAAGGLAAGMSGSPIYFGGRLAGAFSYSFPFADPMIGLFTPIEDMLKGISGRARREGPRVVAVAPFSLGGRTIRRIVLGGSPDARSIEDGTAVAVPASTPPFVAGVGGVVGVLPPMFGVRVVVHDDDAGATRQFRFQVVASKDLAPVLAALGARGVVERALNRSGEGTAKVRMTLHGRMLTREVERTNIFYSGSDIAAQALSEVPEARDWLFEHDFADVAPTGIEIDVRI